MNFDLAQHDVSQALIKVNSECRNP